MPRKNVNPKNPKENLQCKIKKDIDFAQRLSQFCKEILYNLKRGRPRLYYGASSRKKYKDIVAFLNSQRHRLYWKKSLAAEGYWDLLSKEKNNAN